MTIDQVNDAAKAVNSMGRKRLVNLLRRVHCDFKIDFSDEYLSRSSLEHLRHIAMAVLLHARNSSSALQGKNSA